MENEKRIPTIAKQSMEMSRRVVLIGLFLFSCHLSTSFFLLIKVVRQTKEREGGGKRQNEITEAEEHVENSGDTERLEMKEVD